MEKCLSLKPATRKFLPLIQDLLRENDLPIEDIPQIINDLCIAYENSEIIGIGGVEKVEGYGLLRSVVIKSQFRGMGYGKALCNVLVARAKRQDLSDLFLLTLTAAPFFEHLGFKRILREEVPHGMQETAEFRELCPQSSTCMQLKL